MLQLHYFPGNASLIVHLLLEEIGAPFELRRVDRAVQAHKSADYLALNPNGLIPVLVDTTDGTAAEPLVLYETAAIALHLADTHPAAALAPAVGSSARAHLYKWLIWLTNTVQPALIIYFYPERWADDEAGAVRVQAHAEAKIDAMVDQLDAHLARCGGPWLLGDSFSLVDAYAFVLCRWTRSFGRPARACAHLKPWLDAVFARPATQRAFATEALPAPYY